jgi:hypothetical protein
MKGISNFTRHLRLALSAISILANNRCELIYLVEITPRPFGYNSIHIRHL